MVREQLRQRGIDNAAVIAAMRAVPREHFVSPRFHEYAYRDGPIPLPGNQTISQPYIVALMISLIQPQPDHRVLEVGAGSGYAAAVLAQIVRAVYTIERHEALVRYAQQRLGALEMDNVQVRHGDGTRGWLEAAPFDGIIVAAGGPYVPPTLRKQLAINGRLVMPVGKRSSQSLVVVTRVDADRYNQERVSPVRFVPLVGEEGWERGEDSE